MSTAFIHGYCLIKFRHIERQFHCAHIESGAPLPHSLVALQHAKISQLKQWLDIINHH